MGVVIRAWDTDGGIDQKKKVIAVAPAMNSVCFVFFSFELESGILLTPNHRPCGDTPSRQSRFEFLPRTGESRSRLREKELRKALLAMK